MGLGAMEPFGLGHVVNERFALEVRKVHGFRFPRAGQSWKKMRPGSVNVAASDFSTTLRKTIETRLGQSRRFD